MLRPKILSNFAAWFSQSLDRRRASVKSVVIWLTYFRNSLDDTLHADRNRPANLDAVSGTLYSADDVPYCCTETLIKPWLSHLYFSSLCCPTVGQRPLHILCSHSETSCNDHSNLFTKRRHIIRIKKNIWRINSRVTLGVTVKKNRKRTSEIKNKL